MTESDTFTMAEEFADVDFNEERLEKRFRKTMETLAKDPRKSIYGSSANRTEAKAIYNLLGNDKFNKDEILRAHRAAANRLQISYSTPNPLWRTGRLRRRRLSRSAVG
jgi:hypothetical protein